MQKIVMILLVSVMGLLANTVFADSESGLINKKSPYSTTETLDRLSNALKKNGITVFARISHDKNAAGVNLTLRPTELLIFGNPKVGTHFFTSKQTAGIDLPMKALAWQDEKGQVWLTYNDPGYIAKRHGIKDRENVVKKMSGVLEKMSAIAVGK